MTIGSITIGTKLDTTKFDKQISRLEKQVEKEEQKMQLNVQAKVSNDQALERQRQEVDKLASAYQRLKTLKGTINAGKATPEQFTQAQDLERQYGSLEKIDNAFQKAMDKQEKLEKDAQKIANAYNDAQNNANKFKNELNSANLQKQSSEIHQLKDGMTGFGGSIQSAIKKVTKLALGIFGIRSAYMFLRRASNEYAQTNEQYGTNLEYIRWALTQLIAPVLEYILGLAKTILAYINYIANAWFGVNIFANASADSFKKVKKGIDGASGSAKELKKTLAGFDEMNILNSNSTGGGGGAGGAFTMPDFDLSDLSDIEIPDWIKWIADNKDIVIGAIMGIVGALALFKTAGIIVDILKLGTAFFNMFEGMTKLQTLLYTGGIALAIIGIVQAVVSLVQWMQDPTWGNFKGILYGLEVAVGGLTLAFIALNATNPIGWIVLAVDAVALLGTKIADLIITTNEQAKAEEKVATKEELVDYLNGRVIESSKRLKDAREGLTNSTKNYTDAVKNAEEKEKALQKAQDDTGISIDELLKWMDAENIDYKDLNENQRKVYDAYVNNKIAQDNLTTKTKELTEAQNVENQSLADLASALGYATTDAGIFKNAVVKAFNEGKISAETASKLIGAKMSEMSDEGRQAFAEDLPENIKKGLNPNTYQKYANIIHDWWNNKFIGGFQKEVDLTAHAIANVDLNVRGADSLQGISNLIKNLKNQVNGLKGGQGYATGAIVNMPGSGVPIASGVMGEAGREGIIPLTDAQAMAQLGEEIGRNVIINLNNVTQLNGRVLSKELKQVSAEQSFAFNS